MLCMGFEWHLLMYRGVMSRLFQEVTSIVSVYTIVMGAGSRMYGALPVNVLLIQEFSALEGPPGINTSSIEFTIRNDKMYSHSLSYLGNDMAHVDEIRSDEGQWPVYCASSTSWLLMSWRRKAPGHCQQWYWPWFFQNIPVSSLGGLTQDTLRPEKMADIL